MEGRFQQFNINCLIPNVVFVPNLTVQATEIGPFAVHLILCVGSIRPTHTKATQGTTACSCFIVLVLGRVLVGRWRSVGLIHRLQSSKNYDARLTRLFL